MVKHPEEHKKEICLRKGIILMLGGLHQYLENCYHLVCWDGGHPEKEIMVKNSEEHKKEIRLGKGIVLVLGGLNWYLEFC